MRSETPENGRKSSALFVTAVRLRVVAKARWQRQALHHLRSTVQAGVQALMIFVAR